MVITITADMTREEIQKKLAEIKPAKTFDSTKPRENCITIAQINESPKVFDPSKYFGKVKWDEDPVAYQRRLRDE